jgi:hypothetical protein
MSHRLQRFQFSISELLAIAVLVALCCLPFIYPSPALAYAANVAGLVATALAIALSFGVDSVRRAFLLGFAGGVIAERLWRMEPSGDLYTTQSALVLLAREFFYTGLDFDDYQLSISPIVSVFFGLTFGYIARIAAYRPNPKPYE